MNNTIVIFAVLFAFASCQEKKMLNLSCVDEYSMTHKVVDSGLHLEIIENPGGEIEANVLQAGFAGPVSLKKIVVSKTDKNSDEIVFEGKNFNFQLKNASGELATELDKPVTIASRNTPTALIKEKMVCQFH